MSDPKTREKTLGMLGAEIAHELNNHLTVVGGHASLLRERHDLDNELREGLEEIEASCDRAIEAVRRLHRICRERAPKGEAPPVTENGRDRP